MYRVKQGKSSVLLRLMLKQHVKLANKTGFALMRLESPCPPSTPPPPNGRGRSPTYAPAKRCGVERACVPAGIGSVGDGVGEGVRRSFYFALAGQLSGTFFITLIQHASRQNAAFPNALTPLGFSPDGSYTTHTPSSHPPPPPLHRAPAVSLYSIENTFYRVSIA